MRQRKGHTIGDKDPRDRFSKDLRQGRLRRRDTSDGDFGRSNPDDESGSPGFGQSELAAFGTRGPTLLEDFIFREKITHFDHERIPERIVHARGSGAHGYFQPYKSLRS